MGFSFLRNWFTTSTSVSSELDNAEQSNSSLTGGSVEKNDAFEIIEDYEFINPRDPNEKHFSLSADQKDKSIVEIAGFNKEKLLEMSNFSKISYGDDDNKLSEKRCNTLAKKVYKTGFEITTEGYEVIPSPEKMYKTKAKFTSEGYEIIPFGNSFEKDAGHVFIRGKEIVIAYHGTRLKHGLWGLNDLITDLNVSFTTSELLPEGGRIHRGFYNSFTDSWPDLYGILKSHAEKQGSEIKDFKINLTGHSMGGAIAKIAALCLNKTENAEDVHIATFGDPRVFDLTASEFYNEALQEKTIRVTQNRQDPVPAVAPGSFGYAHVGAQLRVSIPEGHSIHTVDGYHEAIKTMDESDFKPNDSVSLFYYPARILGQVSCAVLGNLQHCAANTVNYIFGGSNFFEEVKEEYQNDEFEVLEVEQIAHENSSSIAMGG